MKRSILMLTIFGLLAGGSWMKLYAQDDAATIKGIEEKWAAAATKNDDAAIADILADTVTAIGSEGSLRDKKEMLASMKDRKYTSATEDEIKVHVYGDVAVATGIWHAKGTEKGKPFEEHERFTDTYVKMNGQWKCVATQSSTMAPK